MLAATIGWSTCSTRGEVGRIDLMKATAEAGRACGRERRSPAAQILEQVVMQVDAVQAGLARQDLVEVRQVIVDEMGKWLRWVHARMLFALSAGARGALILSMVQ